MSSEEPAHRGGPPRSSLLPRDCVGRARNGGDSDRASREPTTKSRALNDKDERFRRSLARGRPPIARNGNAKAWECIFASAHKKPLSCFTVVLRAINVDGGESCTTSS